MINDSLISKVIELIVQISKGYQLTIPANIRKEFDLGIGSKVEVKKVKDKIVIEPILDDIERVFAKALKIRPKHDYSVVEMEKLIDNEIN
jgi:AbrB family looped-hinge helix DNA binding protein